VTGPVGAGSCNADYACTFAQGPVGDGSCNANNACENASGSVGAGSCNGNGACVSAGSVGDDSCNEFNACENAGSVGDCQFNAPGHLDDGDCEGVASGVDCDDTDALVTNTNVDDDDCDGVASADDCDDTDALVMNTNVGDGDCDGVASGDDCDDADADEIRELLAVGGCESMTHSFGVDDPYRCGGGFYGEITGGLAPFNLVYTLTSSTGEVFALPVVVINQAGVYSTQAGFIDYSIISGLHAVMLVVTDRAGAELNPAAEFDAVITNQCAPTIGTAILATGDSVASDAELLAAALAARSHPGTEDIFAASVGTEAVTEAVADAVAAPMLAFTGANSDRPVQIALSMLGLGFGSLAVQRRRRNSTFF
jgi:hypothetical protein